MIKSYILRYFASTKKCISITIRMRIKSIEIYPSSPLDKILRGIISSRIILNGRQTRRSPTGILKGAHCRLYIFHRITLKIFYLSTDEKCNETSTGWGIDKDIAWLQQPLLADENKNIRTTRSIDIFFRPYTHTQIQAALPLNPFFDPCKSQIFMANGDFYCSV